MKSLLYYINEKNQENWREQLSVFSKIHFIIFFMNIESFLKVMNWWEAQSLPEIHLNMKLKGGEGPIN